MHVQRHPLLHHIGDGDTCGRRRPVGGGLVPSLHPLPCLFYKGWVRREEGLNFRPGLHCSLLSFSIWQILDPLSQNSNTGLFLHSGPVKRNLLVYDHPRRLQNLCCLLVLCPYGILDGASHICENYFHICWLLWGAERELCAPPKVVLVLPLGG